MSEYLYDAFISHASEDKEDFVLPLVHELQKYGLKIWFAPFSLKIGDSLRESIEMGLSQSRFGIVIFSNHFLAKNWPRAELNGLFAREISGQKVILPIWHRITREDILKHLPIQADKVAANSSDGVLVVARSLVKVIRPEALELDTSRADAEKVNARLLEQLRQQHPGYDFRVTTGVSPSLEGKPNIPGIIASRYDGNTRIDILVKDPRLIKDDPRFQFHVQATGISKIKEAWETGRAQKFVSGEIVTSKTTVPLMDLDLLRNLEMVLIPILPNPGHMVTRVTFGQQPDAVTFPVVEFKPNRAGANETEIVGTGRGLPFRLHLTLPLNGDRTGSVWFSIDFLGCEFTKIQQFMEALEALKKNGRIEITNLETDSVVVEATLNNEEPAIFTEQLVNFVKAVSNISKRFGIPLLWQEEFSDQDFEAVATLKCVMEGLPYGSNFRTTVQVKKRSSNEENKEIFGQFMTGEFSFWIQPEQKPTITLFGLNVPTGPLALHAEKAKIKNLEEAKNKFLSASPGEIVLIEIESVGPVFLKEFAKPAPAAVEP